MQRARLKKSEEYTHSRHMDGGTEAQDPAGVYWEFQKKSQCHMLQPGQGDIQTLSLTPSALCYERGFSLVVR